MRIGLIAEGPTDTPVIRNIVHGFLNGSAPFDLSILPRDEEWLDHLGNRKPTNWTTVLSYLGGDDFRNAFRFLDYVIVQVDTDVSQEPSFDVPNRREDGSELEMKEFVEAVRARLIAQIGTTFFDAMAGQIIFAIAVGSTECWLLPLLYTDNRKSKTTNCEETASQALQARDNYSLRSKDHRNYSKASKPYQKNKELMTRGIHSPSLPFFLEELEKLNSPQP
jgi:hypothetical protein